MVLAVVPTLKLTPIKNKFSAGNSVQRCNSIVRVTISREKEIRMKMARIAIAVTVLLGLFVTANVYAAGCCGGMAGPQSGAVFGDLTKEQQKQVADLRTEFLKKQEQLRTELGNKRIDLMELAQKDSPDEQSIEKKRQEIWSLQDAMRNEARNL